MINLHYGPDRSDAMFDRGHPFDHPFGRLMPEEVIAKVDELIQRTEVLNIMLVEDYPMVYLRYLIRSGKLASHQVHIYWHGQDEPTRELRLGAEGELLDPWPTGFFDRSLEFVLGGWKED